MRWIRELYYKICKFFFWGWKMHNSKDWDYHFFLETMLLKLQRMEDYMINDGHSEDSENERSEMRRSLRVSIALLKRLTTRDNMMYAIHTEKAHEVKWGEIKTTFLPSKVIGNSEGSQVIITRANVNEDNKGQYRKDSKALMDFSYNTYKRDKRLLFQVLAKYLDYMWD